MVQRQLAGSQQHNCLFFLSFAFVLNTKEVKADKKVIIPMVNINTGEKVQGKWL